MKTVKNMIPYIWSLFKIYLNNPNYYVRNTDILSSKFMRGDKDVKEFLKKLNNRLSELGTDKKITFKKNLTYQDVLNKVVL